MRIELSVFLMNNRKKKFFFNEKKGFPKVLPNLLSMIIQKMMMNDGRRRDRFLKYDLMSRSIFFPVLIIAPRKNDNNSTGENFRNASPFLIRFVRAKVLGYLRYHVPDTKM